MTSSKDRNIFDHAKKGDEHQAEAAEAPNIVTDRQQETGNSTCATLLVLPLLLVSLSLLKDTSCLIQ